MDTCVGNRKVEVLSLDLWSTLIYLQCTVDFDIDYGPKITSVYPPLDLTPAEAENMFVKEELSHLSYDIYIANRAFSSFPDSPQAASGSYIHSFRLRQQSKQPSDIMLQGPHTDGFVYGFSYFTQRRDTNARRGYEQVCALRIQFHNTSLAI